MEIYKRNAQRSIAMDFSSSKTSIDKNQFTPQTGTFVGTPSKQTVTARSSSYTSTSSGTPNSPSSPSTVRASAAEQKGHKLELDHERAMSMTGVRDVPVFTDKNITVRLDNETLLVPGQNLAVKNLDIESGKLQVTGRVFSLRYTAQAAPKSFMKRIFK